MCTSLQLSTYPFIKHVMLMNDRSNFLIHLYSNTMLWTMSAYLLNNRTWYFPYMVNSCSHLRYGSYKHSFPHHSLLIRPACHVTEIKNIPCGNISMLHHIDIPTFLFIKEQVIISIMYCGASLRPVSLNLLLP